MSLGRKINDGKSPKHQTNADLTGMKDTGIVEPAMSKRIAHRIQSLKGRFVPTPRLPETGYAAHESESTTLPP